jgi:hypothetical protein
VCGKASFGASRVVALWRVGNDKGYRQNVEDAHPEQKRSLIFVQPRNVQHTRITASRFHSRICVVDDLATYAGLRIAVESFAH